MIQRAKVGDPAAQRRIYQLFSKAMYNICVRMMSSHDKAEDALQEAFIRAFQSLDKLKDESLFAAWLKRIVINECVRFLKRDEPFILSDEELEDAPDHAEGNWLMELRLDEIESAIALLPLGCRQVFNLYAIEDLSHKEIAAVLNISESTSKSQYQRARALLKESLTRKLKNYGRI